MEKLIKKAFTLAEVLITLTIIGVIAAMTVPTLVSNAQDHAKVAKLKKAQSILANAIKMYENENGSIISVWNQFDEENMATSMSKYIKGEVIDTGMPGDGIIAEDGMVYGFHAPYQISVTVDKFDKANNQFGQKPGSTFWFEYTDKGILQPAVMPHGSHSGWVQEYTNVVCPTSNDPWSICTYWTLKTGKINKKKGEWID